MGDVRRLIARLGAASAKLEGGRGGIPDLTPQDIAGAMGYARQTLGRDADLAMGVFCACWWPDTAEGRGGWLQLWRRLMIEAHRRWGAAEDAELTFDLAEAELSWQVQALPPHRRLVLPPELQRVRAAVEQRSREYAALRALCWPRPRACDGQSVYERISKAAIDELANPHHCVHCGGLGWIRSPTGPKACDKCDKRGIVPRSARARAEAVQLSKNGFLAWEPVYQFAVQLASEAEIDAASHLRRALFERAEA